MSTKTQRLSLNMAEGHDLLREVILNMYNENFQIIDTLARQNDLETHVNNDDIHVTKDGTLQAGLNSEMIGGLRAADLATADHNHDDRYYTENESDAKFALKSDSYTKLESDDRYPLKADVYDKATANATFAQSADVYTRAEADTTFARTADVYTKTEVDNQFTLKSDVYTKAESDTRYPLKTDIYTKTEADGRFAAQASVYTKTEANNLFAAKENVYAKLESDNRYPLKTDVYTKAEADGHFATQTNLTEVNTQLSSAIENSKHFLPLPNNPHINIDNTGMIHISGSFEYAFDIGGLAVLPDPAGGYLIYFGGSNGRAHRPFIAWVEELSYSSIWIPQTSPFLQHPDDTISIFPSAAFKLADGTYRMYFCAWRRDTGENWLLCATSDDARNWTWHNNGNAIATGNNIGYANIFLENDMWVAYSINKRFTSSDGLTWDTSNYTTVIDASTIPVRYPKDPTFTPYLYTIHGKGKIWTNYFKVSETRYGLYLTVDYRTEDKLIAERYFAYSDDGINFTVTSWPSEWENIAYRWVSWTRSFIEGGKTYFFLNEDITSRVYMCIYDTAQFPAPPVFTRDGGQVMLSTDSDSYYHLNVRKPVVFRKHDGSYLMYFWGSSERHGSSILQATSPTGLPGTWAVKDQGLSMATDNTPGEAPPMSTHVPQDLWITAVPGGYRAYMWDGRSLWSDDCATWIYESGYRVPAGQRYVGPPLTTYNDIRGSVYGTVAVIDTGTEYRMYFSAQDASDSVFKVFAAASANGVNFILLNNGEPILDNATITGYTGSTVILKDLFVSGVCRLSNGKYILCLHHFTPGWAETIAVVLSSDGLTYEEKYNLNGASHSTIYTANNELYVLQSWFEVPAIYYSHSADGVTWDTRSLSTQMITIMPSTGLYCLVPAGIPCWVGDWYYTTQTTKIELPPNATTYLYLKHDQDGQHFILDSVRRTSTRNKALLAEIRTDSQRVVACANYANKLRVF